jgi:multiple sugar transport system permease protein/N-acetylglucosamine transport system permease protein
MQNIIAQNGVKKKRNLKQMRERGFIVALLAVPIFHFLVFWVYVNARTVLLTFQRFDIYDGVYVWSGVDRFVDFFQKMVLGGDPSIHKAMLNSISSVAVNNFVILPLAFFSSYAFFKKVPGEKLFRILFFMPSMISVVVLTMSFKYMFNSEFGPISLLFDRMGFNIDFLSASLSSKTIWPLIWIYCVWAGLGANVILISGAMGRIPRDVIESGKVDGIGFWRECFSITLPLILPTISTYFLMGIMGMFGFMMQPMLIAGQGGGEQGKTMTVALHIFNLVNTGSESSAINAAAFGLIFSLIGAPVVIIVKLILDKITPEVVF